MTSRRCGGARFSFDAGDGRAWAPNVIGPEQIPRITSIDEAARSPELAVLSAAVHGRAPDGARVVHATLAAVAQLDEERRECFGNLLAVVLGDVARVAMEALMTLGKNPFEGAMERLFERHYRKLERQARTEERCVAIRNVLLMVLAERGLGPSEETRVRASAETDLRTLERWVRRAVTATSEPAVFEHT